jgi:hypothetical protein
VVLGVQPLDLTDTGSAIGAAIYSVAVLGLAAITFVKGRILLGAVALFIPLAGLYAAVRLAKPGSPWAKRRYRGSRAHLVERARERYRSDRPLEVLGARVRNAIGGAPTGD